MVGSNSFQPPYAQEDKKGSKLGEQCASISRCSIHHAAATQAGSELLLTVYQIATKPQLESQSNVN